MKFHKLAIGAMLTIATAVGSQSAALSQQQFKNPTHPTLSEIGNSQAFQPSSSSQQQFKNPTHPTLSEIGTSEPTSRSMTQSEVLQPQISQQKLSNGQTFFSHPPRLVRVNASQKQAYALSTYEFTLTVPADAGQPLKAVRIVQARNTETVRFDVSRSRAFAGERFASGVEIPLASVGGTQSAPGEATIVFAQPVQPGSTVTLAFEATNPTYGGVYEFGLTAFPDGENGIGQFLGFGRLNFYSGGEG
ncbi:DUF2808 domain-containing protein [Phormidesmis priestleyi ULC007]|uniref:DUF2808 domain-containing protein n=1 Tax=Phormidesmis priestleyi ULC007 TaxID=1920490 RepID=A0A2T1D5C4_9CYAN|nr:DUF2808 domain-containing protein [Phormidesmis priestleyi]PSB15680.1 DUF2808 domain-containing protein [Phormidesmis priestleyi ULC007]PZO48372.1 MAG: DUF2808 domain-containing protein [Phormidesmis priestleyi]